MATDGNLSMIADTPKVGRFGKLLIGHAGAYGPGQEMFELAEKAERPTVASLFKQFAPKGQSWTLLAVEGWNIYELDNTRGRLKAIKRKGYAYHAIGAGAHAALGALYVRHEGPNDLLLALEAAAEHTPSVRKPFYIVGIDR